MLKELEIWTLSKASFLQEIHYEINEQSKAVCWDDSLGKVVYKLLL